MHFTAALVVLVFSDETSVSLSNIFAISPLHTTIPAGFYQAPTRGSVNFRSGDTCLSDADERGKKQRFVVHIRFVV